MEDYNTATMPSMKYYDLRKWEEMERTRKLAKQARKLRKGITDDVTKEFDDEAARDKEIRAEQEKRKHMRVAEALTSMDREKAAAMRQQQLLRSKMVMAHRSGDKAEAARIQKLLEPDAT